MCKNLSEYYNNTFSLTTAGLVNAGYLFITFSIGSGESKIRSRLDLKVDFINGNMIFSLGLFFSFQLPVL